MRSNYLTADRINYSSEVFTKLALHGSPIQTLNIRHPVQTTPQSSELFLQGFPNKQRVGLSALFLDDTNKQNIHHVEARVLLVYYMMSLRCAV